MNREDASRTVIALYESWYMWLLRYAARAMGDIHRAEDLVQEVFMRLYQELCIGKEIERPQAWTLIVLRHEIGREIRSLVQDRKVYEPLEAAEVPGIASSESQETELIQGEIEKFFSILTPREQEVILLRMQAMKYREIAANLKISSSAVNTLLARALRKLQRAANRNSNELNGSDHVEQSIPKTLQ